MFSGKSDFLFPVEILNLIKLYTCIALIYILQSDQGLLINLERRQHTASITYVGSIYWLITSDQIVILIMQYTVLSKCLYTWRNVLIESKRHL